jgi:hypothetical protein
MTLWMCLNCVGDNGMRGKPFRAEKPVCPCGVDGTKPEYAGYTYKCVVYHYDPPHPTLKGMGTRKALCDGRPGASMDHNKETTTAAFGVVNCLKCLAHPNFPGHEPTETVVSEEYDYSV